VPCSDVLAGYNLERLTLAAIGSHSALDLAAGARAQGLANLIVTAKGREQTYTRHFARSLDQPARGCVDETLELDAFSDLLQPRVQEQLLSRNVLFVPNRSFEVYLRQAYRYAEIEEKMRVPILGNRALLRAEERDEAENQYALLDHAGIRRPLQFATPSAIDRLVMVKAPHAKVGFERSFFVCGSAAEYERAAGVLIAEGRLSEEGLKSAVIEEYALGPTVNLNFFYSPILGELELLGTDTRRQTNLDGLRALPPAHLAAAAAIPASMEEAGHLATTLTESMLEPAFEAGERLVRAAREWRPPGLLGPFALQCVIVAGPPKAFLCYDLSLRIPGSPGTRYTPYSAYRWGRDISAGERIAMEVVFARDAGRLQEILT
jgi:5-formaminoimidazole-4-carboxamide-1-(beta)-D-ribofuranosyl 5'-monophosphate synthetase